MLRPGHAVGDHRREERLDRAEHRDRQRCRKEDAQRAQIERQLGGERPRLHRQWRKPRNPVDPDAVDQGVKSRPDGRHVDAMEVQPVRGDGSDRQRDERRGNALRQPWHADEQRERREADPELRKMHCGARVPQCMHALGEVVGRPRRHKAEQVLELQHADDGPDAGGETGGDRMGNELDEPSQPEESHRDEDQSRHRARDEEAADSEARHDGREDHHERGGGPRHLEARSAEQRHDRAGDDRGVEAVLRRHSDGDGERHRKRERDDADHDTGEDVGAQLARPIAVGESRTKASGGEEAKRRRSRRGGVAVRHRKCRFPGITA